jgi:hypothetical protein
MGYTKCEVFMASVTLTDNQVVELVQQLPAPQKRAVLLLLARDAQSRYGERMAQAEERLRALARERGLVWETLDDDAREAFIDDLLHEGR